MYIHYRIKVSQTKKKHINNIFGNFIINSFFTENKFTIIYAEAYEVLSCCRLNTYNNMLRNYRVSQKIEDIERIYFLNAKLAKRFQVALRTTYATLQYWTKERSPRMLWLNEWFLPSCPVSMAMACLEPSSKTCDDSKSRNSLHILFSYRRVLLCLLVNFTFTIVKLRVCWS